MSISTKVFESNDTILEKVILNNDLSGLSSKEKVQYVTQTCLRLGLDPMTRPFQLIKFQGKEIIYATKDATEQLRKKYNVSLSIVETKIIDDIYIAIAEAKLPDGRTDSSTGAVTIGLLKGDAKCNAIMKAETKAKRRVTLSICGLGFIDESELDTMKGHIKVDIETNDQQKAIVHELPSNNYLLTKDDQEFLEMEFVDYKGKINLSKSIEELTEVFIECKNLFRKSPELMEKIILLKDKRKFELGGA